MTILTETELQKLYDNRLTPSQSWINKQKEHFPKYIWKNKNIGVCSTTEKRNKTISKRLTKRTSFNTFQKEYFTYIKGTTKRIEFQEYEFVQTTPNGIEQWDIKLRNLVQITPQRTVRLSQDTWNNLYDKLNPVQPFYGGSFMSYIDTGLIKKAITHSFLKDIYELDKNNILEWENEYEYPNRKLFDRFTNIIKYQDTVKKLLKYNAKHLLVDLINKRTREINPRTYQKLFKNFNGILKTNPTVKSLQETIKDIQNYNKTKMSIKTILNKTDIIKIVANKQIPTEYILKLNLQYLDLDNILILKEGLYSKVKCLNLVYKYKNEIEFCQKIKATNFINDWLQTELTKTNTINLTRDWLKKNKVELKNNPSLEVMNSQKTIMDLKQEYKINKEKTISYVSKMGNLNKYVQYIKYVFSLYEKPAKEIVYPNNFTLAFKEIESAYNNKSLQERFKIAYKHNKKYQNTFDGYTFIVPRKPEELVAEGIKLNNCLASYRKRYANEQTIILFVRKATEPNKSLYALEIMDNEIVQLRAKNNVPANDNVRTTVEKYLKQTTAVAA